VSLAIVIALGVAACADSAPKGDALVPDLTGKADIADRVTLRGTLSWGEAAGVSGAFTEDLSFDAWALAVRPGARLALEITHKGSSARLDTTLFVYGPRTDAGGYGTTALAFDDDAGWGRLSRLSALTLAAGGDYLVVVGTADGRGRGAYHLVARCADALCGPLPPAPSGGCPLAITAAISACIDDGLAASDYDPYTTSRLDLLERCADAEVVAPAWDALCAAPDAPSALCAATFASFASEQLPLCEIELRNATLDASCIFGDRYRDLWDHPDATVILWHRTLTTPSGLDTLEADQIVRAVRETAYSDVATLDEAFAAVDEGLVNQTAVWDASDRKAYMVYEVGAGDNSFGAYFAHGTTEVVARIVDGDLADCTPTWGRERRVCGSDGECQAGLRCVGRPEGLARGRCLDPTAVEDAASGSACTGVDGCPAGAGLVCGGAAYGAGGSCLPAWMRARFNARPVLSIPDAPAAGAVAEVLAYGLATVDVEVAIDLYLTHPRVSELRVTLTNPMGTTVPVFEGEQGGSELVLEDAPVRGFSGDEAVNGVWRLTVTDTKSGETGTLQELALTVTSRWD